MQTAVTLTLNGEARAFDGPMTVAALLATLGLETRKVAVERNAEIVPRSSYAETWLAERRCAGDRAFHRGRLRWMEHCRKTTPGRWPAAASARA